jgi:hypothetical protein
MSKWIVATREAFEQARHVLVEIKNSRRPPFCMGSFP